MNYNMYLKWLTYLVIVLSQFQRYIQYLHGEEKRKIAWRPDQPLSRGQVGENPRNEVGELIWFGFCPYFDKNFLSDVILAGTVI